MRHCNAVLAGEFIWPWTSDIEWTYFCSRLIVQSIESCKFKARCGSSVLSSVCRVWRPRQIQACTGFKGCLALSRPYEGSSIGVFVSQCQLYGVDSKDHAIFIGSLVQLDPSGLLLMLLLQRAKSHLLHLRSLWIIMTSRMICFNRFHTRIQTLLDIKNFSRCFGGRFKNIWKNGNYPIQEDLGLSVIKLGRPFLILCLSRHINSASKTMTSSKLPKQKKLRPCQVLCKTRRSNDLLSVSHAPGTAGCTTKAPDRRRLETDGANFEPNWVRTRQPWKASCFEMTTWPRFSCLIQQTWKNNNIFCSSHVKWLQSRL